MEKTIDYIPYDDFRRYMRDIRQNIQKYDSTAIVRMTPVGNMDYVGRTYICKERPYNSRNFKVPIQVIFNAAYLQDAVDTFNGVDFVRADVALLYIWTGNHETAHVRLNSREFIRTDASDMMKKIARVSLCTSYLPEYGDAKEYANLPEDVFCEIYAFNETSKFCVSENFSFDWKSLLTERAKRAVYISHRNLINNYDDIDKIFRNELSLSFESSHISDEILDRKRVSHEFKKLLYANEDLCYNILYADNGRVEVNLLSRYIAENEMMLFRQYPCIKDDYKEFFSLKDRCNEKIIGDGLFGIKGYTVDDFNDIELLRNSGYDEDKVNVPDIKDGLGTSRTDPTDDW